MAANNAINNNAVTLTGPSYVGVNYATGYVNVNSGSNTIVYTCPSDKRAYPLSCMIRNPTGGAINCLFYLRTGGVDYLLTQTITINANTSLGENSANTTNNQRCLSIILEPGESIVVNGNGLNVFLAMFEYANSVPVFSSKSFLGATSNTIYTVPANKKALCGVNSITQQPIGMKNVGVTANAYAIPSGGSVNAIYNLGTSTSSNFSIFAMPQGGQFVLNSGDFILITLSVASSSIAWVNVWEFS